MRIFFACFLSPSAARALTVRLPDVSGMRPVPVENLHTTLHFLGSVSEDRAPALRTLAARLPEEPLAVTIRELTGLPRADAARVTVARLDPHPWLLEWQALLASGWPTADTRRFDPHVTLARSRRRVRLPVMPDLSGMVLELQAPGAYVSDTRPEGARYRRFA